MELRDYLHINRISVNQLAETIEYTRNYISSVKHGKIKPSDKFIRAVERATKGDVTKKDILQTFIDRQKRSGKKDTNNSTIVQT